jgi:K+ transporter
VFGLSPLADAVMVYLLVALALCATILVITILEKFVEGGWLTLLVSAVLLAACFAIKRHYGSVVVRALRQLDSDLPSPPEAAAALSASRKASSVSRPSPPIGGVPSP